MSSSRIRLKVAIGSYGNTQALKDGTVAIQGVDADFVEVAPVHEIFRQMIQRQRFDVAEMSLATYILARSFGAPLAALAVVPLRMFHHGSIWRNVDAAIRGPGDLEGRLVGVRSYAQTGPVWSRGILQHEYGVDPGRVRWVTFEDSHVPQYRDPPNAVRAPRGASLQAMLASGELDAALSLENLGSDRVAPLFRDAAGAEAQWFEKYGIYPINHILVMRSDLAAGCPALPGAIFDAFERAKQIYLNRLEAEGPAGPQDRAILRLKSIVGGDPLPYGVERNRESVEMLAQYAYEQRIVPARYRVEELFEPAVMGLE